MTQYDNNMRGILGRNDRREKDSHPEFKGQCEINGEEFWISAWVKESAKGKFFSLSFQPKEAKAAPKKTRQAVDDESDVPF